jgi:1-acylglycerone phosphate reductase
MKGFSHPEICTLTVDVTKDDNVEQAVAFIIGEEGRIDIVVSNAGGQCIGTGPASLFSLYSNSQDLGPISDVTTPQATEAFDTNVIALMRITRVVVPHMAARRSGKIVAVGLVAGIV